MSAVTFSNPTPSETALRDVVDTIATGEGDPVEGAATDVIEDDGEGEPMQFGIIGKKEGTQEPAPTGEGAGEDDPAKAGEENGKEGAAAAGASGAAKEDAKEIPDSVFLEYMRKKGVDVSDIEDVVKAFKIANQTPEDVKKAQLEREAKRLNLFVENNGTPEQFVNLNKITRSDVNEIGLQVFREQEKAYGATDADINEYITANTVSDEELSELEDDERKALIRKRNAFKTRIETLGKGAQAKAKEILDGLDSVIDTQNKVDNTEEEFMSNVDRYFLNRVKDRKVEFGLGERNKKSIPPIEFEFTENDVEIAKKDLKEFVKKNKIYNKEVLDEIGELFLKKAYLNGAVQTAFFDAETRSAKMIASKFGQTASAVGVSHVDAVTNNNKSKGKFAFTSPRPLY